MNSLPGLDARTTLDDIFQTACDLPPDQRSVYLEKACAGDETLRREIEDLLRYYETNKTFLENPAIQDVAKELAASGSMSASTRPRPMIGKQIGNYRILAMIGRGGMGEVYLARDLELDVDVVIKFLREEYQDDPEWQARFNREGRLNAELSHPNIAKIHYKGEIEGRQFLVFEYVAGETLEERLDRGPLAIREALPIFHKLASALSAAHQKGIIHRDLKPSNLMITPDGDVKILDFGIAKRVNTDLTTVDLEYATASSQLTRDFGDTRKGEVIGTVAYMSPEQTRGESLAPQTDIWSLAAVLYEALTCQRPFKGVDTYDTLGLIRSPKAEPDWRALPPKTPKPVLQLLRRCFEKDPHRRLGSAADAQRVIEKAEAAINAGPFSFWPKHFNQQLALVSILLLLLIASVSAGRMTWNWYFNPIPKVKYLAVLPFQDAGDAQGRRIGGGLAKSLYDLLSQVPENELKLMPYSAIAKTYAERPKAAAEVTSRRALQLLGTNLILSGEVKYVGEGIEVEYRILNDQLKVIKSNKISGAGNELRKLQTQLAREVVAALNIPTREFRDRTDFRNPREEAQLSQAISDLQGDLSAEQVEGVIARLKSLTEPGAPARAYAVLAQAYLRQFTLAQKTESLDEALKACEKATQLDDGQKDVEVQVSRGLALTALGQNPDAINIFQAALAQHPNHPEALLGLAAAYDGYEPPAEDQTNYAELAEQTYRQAVNAWPNYWSVRNELGAFLFSRGRYQEALDEWLRVIQVLPESYSGQVNLANAYFKVGKLNEAENVYQQLVAQDGNSVEALAGLGTVQFYLKNYSAAAQSFLRAAEINPNKVTPWGNLGDAYRMLAGAENQSIQSYDKALGILQQLLRGNPPNATPYQARLAELYAKRSAVERKEGNASGASKDADQALTIARRIASDPSPDVVIMTSLVLIYHLAGQDEEAVNWAEKALENNAEALEFRQNPEFDALRISSERFQRALNKHLNQ